MSVLASFEAAFVVVLHVTTLIFCISTIIWSWTMIPAVHFVSWWSQWGPFFPLVRVWHCHPLLFAVVASDDRFRSRFRCGRVGWGPHLDLSPGCCLPIGKNVWTTFLPILSNEVVVKNVLWPLTYITATAEFETTYIWRHRSVVMNWFKSNWIWKSYWIETVVLKNGT